MVVFFALLNVAGINCHVAYLSNHPNPSDLKRKTFLREIALALIEQQKHLPLFVQQEFTRENADTSNLQGMPGGSRKYCVETAENVFV